MKASRIILKIFLCLFVISGDVYAQGGCTIPSAPTANSPGSATMTGTSSSATPTLFWTSNGGTVVGYDPAIRQCPFGLSDVIWYQPCVGATYATIPALPKGNLYSWNVEASCDCAGTNSDTSNTLYFNVPPEISYSGPTSFCQGGSLYLHTLAGNPAGNPGFQWYRDGI